MKAGLMKLATKTSELQSLKCQLEFRKKVLEEDYGDKSVFYLSRNRRKLSVDEVCSNHCKLYPPVSAAACDKEGVVGKRIKHKWNIDGT